MLKANSRAGKAGVIALEIVGVLIAALAGGAVFLYWRLQSGPLSAGLFEDAAEFAIERGLPPGHTVEITNSTLSRNAARGSYNLAFDGVEIRDGAEEPVASFPRISLDFAAGDILRGAIGPQRIVIERPAFRIVRRADLTFSLDNGRGRGAGLAATRRVLGQAFQSAELQHAEIEFVDMASGATWTARDAEASIVRAGNGYRANIHGDFNVDGEESFLALEARYTESSGITAAKLDVQRAPLGDILEVFYGQRAAILSAPVSGSATLTLARSGDVVASTIKGRAEAGVLMLGGKRRPIDYIEVDAAFDPIKNAFDVRRAAIGAGGSVAAVAGDIGLVLGDAGRTPERITFSLRAADAVIDTGGFFPEPLAIARAEIEGGYDVGERSLSVSSLSADLLGVTLAGSFAVDQADGPESGGRPSPKIVADLKVEGSLDAEHVLLGWPMHRGEGAREFVATRLPRGVAENIALKLDLPEGAVRAGEPLPDEALALTFDIRDATALYSPGMTPLTSASGSAKLSGNRFLIKPAHGRIGNMALTHGEVDFTALAPRGMPVHFRFRADGESREILSVLNEEPLALLKKTPFDPSRFSGKATVNVDIERPNRREVERSEYTYNGGAAFSDITISEIFTNNDLTGLKGKIDLKPDGMTLTGEGDIGGSAVGLTWTQELREGGSSTFEFMGAVDGGSGDIFGFPLRRMLTQGAAKYAITAKGDLGAIDTLSVKANLTEAALTFDSLGWTKPLGAPATGELDIRLHQGGFDIEKFALQGEAAEASNAEPDIILDIDGAASFARDGAVETAEFSKIFMKDSANLELSAKRNEAGLLDVVVTGEFLNAGPLVESIVDAGPREGGSDDFNWGEGVIVTGRIDEVHLRGDAQYSDATLDLRHGGERIQELSFSARTGDGKPVSVTLKETGADMGPVQLVEARTDDIGSLLAGVFGVKSIRGGEGSMEIAVNRNDGEPGGLTGVLEARRMRVVGAPLLARVFAAGSLNGLTDLLNDEGIELSRGYARFGFRDGIVTVEQARASGPSVGITSSGRIESGAGGAVTLSGAVAPAYQVNSLLGRTPIIGDIFVSREGEGVVALSYDVKGPASSPTVTVNPLSALAPGFLRRMFEFDRNAPEAGEPPAEAEEPAAEAEAPPPSQ